MRQPLDHTSETTVLVYYTSVVGYHQTLPSVDVNFDSELTATGTVCLNFFHARLCVFLVDAAAQTALKLQTNLLAKRHCFQKFIPICMLTLRLLHFSPAKLVSLKLNAYLNVSSRI